MSPTHAHWHILGAGAIGCLFAAKLHRIGCNITLILRHPDSRDSVPVLVQDGDTDTQLQLPVFDPAQGTAITHLLVTTKAYDVHTAVAGIRPFLAPDCQMLLMVNGMGLVEQLQADAAYLRIYAGTTTEGAYRLGTQHIQYAGRGETRLGRQGQREPAGWFEPWATAVEACVWDSNIDAALWSKLTINCIINPLTALHGCRNGELASRENLAAEVTQLCAEIAQISAAAGFADIAARLPQAVSAVIAGTANNRSSMRQDLESGRPTEIDYITGYLLQVAARHGLAAPRNQALYEEIKKRVY